MSDDKYDVMEVFTSIQGEGAFQGEKATFVRFFGCNLRCSWCDTKNSWEGNQVKPLEKLSVEEIVNRIPKTALLVVLTGGEPTLQNLLPLLIEIRAQIPEVTIAIETNGTIDLDQVTLDAIDWITVSPKPPLYEINISRVDELKYVVDDAFTTNVIPEDLIDSTAITLQVESAKPPSARKAFELVMNAPDNRFKIGVQLHKILDVQ